MQNEDLQFDFEDMHDALTSQSMPNELLDDWGAREERILSHQPQELPAKVREAVLRYSQQLSQMAGLQHTGWFDTAMYIDYYCLRCPGGADINTLPAVATALIGLLKKKDSAEQKVRTSDYASQAPHLAGWIQMLGYKSVDSNVTVEKIHEEEHRILEILRWQINLPSTFSWMSSFCVRFNVFTCNKVTQSLAWIWEHYLLHARNLVLRYPLSPTLAPRSMANGLFCLGLVCSRMIPLELLRPEKLESREWEETFMKSQGQTVKPECWFPPQQAKVLAQAVLATTGCSASTLKKDSYCVAQKMLEMIDEFTCK